ncbi:MAG: hypothetical protein ACRDHP_01355 [Ktedonobacterales bacterium]
MRDRSADFEEGSGPAPSNASPFPPASAIPFGGKPPQHSFGYGPRRAADLRTLRDALRDSLDVVPPPPSIDDMDDELEVAGGAADTPTNVYYLAQYMYQISINAVTMADHELGLLLPRSGRIWFNARLFTDVPRGRELAQRDAWWRVVDASTAIRFLLGWCVGLYRTAKFRHVAHEQLPGWSRILYFSPTIPDCTKTRVNLWSDVVQDVTTLFAPPTRVWRQIQVFTPIRPGDRRWQARLALANHRVEDVLHFLADRNNCPATLIRRSLDGNLPIPGYDDYLAFTESILEDLPRLRMQRLIAMQNKNTTPARQNSGGHVLSKLPNLLKSQWLSDMDDPRQNTSFWQLHL